MRKNDLILPKLPKYSFLDSIEWKCLTHQCTFWLHSYLPSRATEDMHFPQTRVIQRVKLLIDLSVDSLHVLRLSTLFLHQRYLGYSLNSIYPRQKSIQHQWLYL